MVNDLAAAFPGSRLSWRLEGPDGRVLAKGGQIVDFAPDCVLEAEAVVAHPDVGGRWRLLAELRSSDGNSLTMNQLDFVVKEAKAPDRTTPGNSTTTFVPHEKRFDFRVFSVLYSKGIALAPRAECMR